MSKIKRPVLNSFVALTSALKGSDLYGEPTHESILPPLTREEQLIKEQCDDVRLAKAEQRRAKKQAKLLAQVAKGGWK